MALLQVKRDEGSRTGLVSSCSPPLAIDRVVTGMLLTLTNDFVGDGKVDNKVITLARSIKVTQTLIVRRIEVIAWHIRKNKVGS